MLTSDINKVAGHAARRRYLLVWLQCLLVYVVDQRGGPPHAAPASNVIIIYWNSQYSPCLKTKPLARDMEIGVRQFITKTETPF